MSRSRAQRLMDLVERMLLVRAGHPITPELARERAANIAVAVALGGIDPVDDESQTRAPE
jgi:hypothetical protein